MGLLYLLLFAVWFCFASVLAGLTLIAFGAFLCDHRHLRADRNRDDRRRCDVDRTRHEVSDVAEPSLGVRTAVTLLLPLVAALPQHVWEVVATAIAVVFVGSGLHSVITGESPGPEWFSERAVRLIGAVVVLLGVGIGVSGFLVSGGGGAGWGGTYGVVILIVWLAGFGAVAVYGLKKDREDRR